MLFSCVLEQALKFCDVVAHWFLRGKNSTGDIPNTEMLTDMQPDLYGMGKAHNLHVKCYNCVFSVLKEMSVKCSGQFPLTEPWTIFVVLKSINCCTFNIDKLVNNLSRSADSDSLLISCMALF